MPASKAKQDEVADRREKVLARRAIGIPPAVIAAELGISEATVYDDVHRTLKARREAVSRDRDLLVILEAEELDAVRRRAWEIANGEHLHVATSGRVSVHPGTGEPLHDVNPVIQALGLILRTQARRAPLLGLDSAQKLEMRTEVITLDAIDAAINDLRAQVAAAAALDGGDVPQEA
jgi:DNA-binding CsgD family transcriptional regulator